MASPSDSPAAVPAARRSTAGGGWPRLALRPRALLAPAEAAGAGLPLAGGPLRFAELALYLRRAPREIRTWHGPPEQVLDRLAGEAPALAAEGRAALARLTAARPSFAGLDLDRPRIMGILNVTPDSFSDGGDRFDPGRAVADGLAMLEAGADLLDVGGESTRPGSDPVPPEEELRRVRPVVRGLVAAGAAVSIDSRRARVMDAALEAGAVLVNDVTALTGDPESLPLLARSGVPVVLMHMQGEPRSMQAEPRYDDAALDVHDYLAARIEVCLAAGIERGNIAVDPGIGFGKTLAHNLDLLERLALLHDLGCAVLLGVSRKSWIARLSAGEAPKQRLAGSLAGALAGVARGAQILRVHDVAETAQALAVWRAIGRGASTEARPAES